MNPGRALVGIAIIGFGVLLLLDRSGDVDAFATVRTWWPVAIVALGVAQLALDPSSLPGSGIVVVGGLVLLGLTTGLFGTSFLRYAGPVLLIGAGLWVVLGRPGFSRSVTTAERLRLVVAFGLRTVTAESAPFSGGSASVFFGNGTVDLRNARPGPEPIEVSATVCFGGLDLIVPEGWNVKVRGVPIFGGWDDTTQRNVKVDAAHAAVMRVNALVAFGGIEVRHHSRWL